MRAVRRTDTGPEMIVRKLLHAQGYKFRLHRGDLPGTPDIVLPRFRTAIFVHGCFWHRHESCSKSTTPKTRVRFWTGKFEQNVARDRKNEDLLRELGWTVLIVWGCEVRSQEALWSRLQRELPDRPPTPAKSVGLSR